MARALLFLVGLIAGGALLAERLGGGLPGTFAALALFPGVPVALWARRLRRIWRTGVYEQLAWTHELSARMLFRLPGLGLLWRLGRRHGSAGTQALLDDLETPARIDWRDDRGGWREAFAAEAKLFGFALLFTAILFGGLLMEAAVAAGIVSR